MTIIDRFMSQIMSRFMSARLRRADQVLAASCAALALPVEQADLLLVEKADDGTFLVRLAPHIRYTSIARDTGRVLSESSAEVVVRARLAVALRGRGAVFAGYADSGA